ncbi:hypothetical protein [Glycomyces paridis]|uniref:WXG100 family type VII secretion target n=1 Tax=Glycomyces paridis TaxID=2126555 RepID=A0A4V4HMU7_9ACTN|nr:hypothetical protein [Glycomyces paridis]THV23536.1 hypothetical protein E9998_22320 [Glycomyces paridis]
MGDGTYFDDAPQQSDFGTNADGTILNDPAAAVTKALENFPGYKQTIAGISYIEDTGPLIGKLFDGEATFDDLFTIVDTSLTLAVNIIETIELGMAAGELATGDPFGVLGTAVSTMTSIGLTFLLESLQPVQDLFGMITGNPGRIRVSRDMWEALATGLVPIGVQLVDGSNKLGAVWSDTGADAARLRMLEGNDVIQVAAALSSGVSGSLEFCASTFEKVQGYLVNRASDIAGALVSYIPWFWEGPKGWVQIILDFLPMIARIIIELVQIALHLARALGAILGLIQGAQVAAQLMNPYIDRMSTIA